MGFQNENAPLLQSSGNLELNEHQKREIEVDIGAQVDRMAWLHPIFVILHVLLAVVFIILGVMIGGFFFILSGALYSVSAAIHTYRTIKARRNIQQMRMHYPTLFTHNYIGSFVYDRNTLPIFNSNYYRLTKVYPMTLSIIGMTLFCGGVTLGVCLFILVRGFNMLLAICISLPLTASGLIFLIGVFISIAVPRLRSFNPVIHSCVLGRGLLYNCGRLYVLQPATACSTPFVSNLISVELGEIVDKEKGRVHTLTINMTTEGKKPSFFGDVVIPIPHESLPLVVSWLRTFTDGYTNCVKGVSVVPVKTVDYQQAPLPLTQNINEISA